MKITRVESFPVTVPMRIPYITALTHKDVSSFAVVVVHTDEGIDGIGQATVSAPRYQKFEQTLDHILLTIRELLAPAVVGMDPFEIGLIHEKMDKVALGHRYAQSAIDTACYDIMGRAAGTACRRVARGARRETITMVAPHLGYLEPEVLSSLAVQYQEEGLQSP